MDQEFSFEKFVKEVEQPCILCGQLTQAISKIDSYSIEGMCLNKNHYSFIRTYAKVNFTYRSVVHEFENFSYEIRAEEMGNIFINSIYRNKFYKEGESLTIYKPRSVGRTTLNSRLYEDMSEELLIIHGPSLDFFFQKLSEEVLLNKIKFYNTFS